MALTPVVIRDGNNVAQSMDAFQDPSGNNISLISLDSTRAVYKASANFIPTATAGVVLFSIQGSATKTVRIKRILIGGVSTALSSSVFAIQKTSVLGAGGTAVAPTVAKMDSGSAAASAVVQHYTTTLKAAGTPIGGPLSTMLITTGTVTTPTVALAGTPQAMFPEFGAPIGQALVLRGIAEYIEVQNVTPTNLAAGTVLTYAVEWEEDAS